MVLPALNQTKSGAAYGQIKSRGKMAPSSNGNSMGSQHGRKSRGPGVSSLNGGIMPKIGGVGSSVSGAGFKAGSSVYGGPSSQKPILGSGSNINSGNVFNIPKYGSGGLGGGIGGMGSYGSGSLGGGIGSSGGLGSGSGLN